jgi:hypothetical protein
MLSLRWISCGHLVSCVWRVTYVLYYKLPEFPKRKREYARDYENESHGLITYIISYGIVWRHQEIIGNKEYGKHVCQGKMTWLTSEVCINVLVRWWCDWHGVDDRCGIVDRYITYWPVKEITTFVPYLHCIVIVFEHVYFKWLATVLLQDNQHLSFDFKFLDHTPRQYYHTLWNLGLVACSGLNITVQNFLKGILGSSFLLVGIS